MGGGKRERGFSFSSSLERYLSPSLKKLGRPEKNKNEIPPLFTHRDGRGRGLPDLVRLVRLVPVRLQPVSPRVDRRRRQAELGAGAEGADGDLAAVGAHDLPEGCELVGADRDALVV